MGQPLRKDEQSQAWFDALTTETAELTDEELELALSLIYAEYISRIQKNIPDDGRGSWTGS
jgi:hypothetical protein